MRSNVIFDSLHLDRFLYIGWSIVVIMLSLMEDTFGSIWSLSCLTYWCLMDFWVWRQFIDHIGFILLSCITYPHWGIFPIFSKVPSCCWTIWLSLFMVIEMFDWFWWILYCTSNIHTGAYSPLHNEIVFVQRYIDGWSLLVVYLTTSTSDTILGHIPLSLVRFCLGNGMKMDD